MITFASDLTAFQLRFADEYGARPGIDANDGSGVFFYREGDGWVHRWLVDWEGNIRERADFRKHSPQ